MKVFVQGDDGTLLWWRDAAPAGGFTADGYLQDGTQQKIIAALIEALGEARGQLGSPSLKIVDAVSEAGAAAAEVDCCVPLAVVWNRDAGR
jgi:hypothetical protein